MKAVRYTPEDLNAMYAELKANPSKANHMYSIAFAKDFISKEIGKEISVKAATDICDELIAKGEPIDICTLTKYIKIKGNG